MNSQSEELTFVKDKMENTFEPTDSALVHYKPINWFNVLYLLLVFFLACGFVLYLLFLIIRE